MTSFLDVIGIGVIGPYMAIIINEKTSIDSFFPVFGHKFSHNESVNYLGLLLIIVFTIKAILSIFINYKIIKFGTDQQARLRHMLLDSYLSLPYVNFVKRNSSEYTHAIQNLVNHYSDGVVMPLLRMLSNGIITLFVILYLAFSHPLILLILIILLLTTVLGYHLFFRSKIRYKGKLLNRSSTSIFKILNESIDGFKEIKVLGVGNYSKSLLKAKAIEYGDLYSYVKTVALAPRYLIELAMVLFIVCLTMGAGFNNTGTQDLIVVISTFGVAAVRLLPSATIFSQGLSQLSQNRNSVFLLNQDIENIDKLKRPINNNQPFKMKDFSLFKEIEVKNLIFSYESSNKVVDNLSLKILSGESIGFIGGSGSGKTTLINIIIGLLKPDFGSVEIDGFRLTDDNVQDWQKNIAYLPQQIFLIDDTLMKNIAFGIPDEKIDNERVLISLKKAKLLSFVETLEAGVNTIIGESGVKLSGGQRQRIALARAFYHERGILILDESTSALDSETEQEIIKEVNDLKGRVTIIMIAHRHSTLRNCDKVFRLRDGKVETSGSPKELLNL